MTPEQTAQALISQGVEWKPGAKGVARWVVRGREGEKLTAIIREIGGESVSVDAVALLLTTTLNEKYEQLVASTLTDNYKIEYRPRPGQTMPRWFINGRERQPGPFIETVRASIARKTGYNPARSLARERRILNLIKQQGACSQTQEGDNK